MSRNVYTLAVLRWPQAQLVESEATNSTDPASRHLLNQLFEEQHQDFAMYSNFMDGWDHTDHIFSRDPDGSLFMLLGAQAISYELVRFHPNNLTKSKKLWNKYYSKSSKSTKDCLNKYAITSLFHWLDVGFGFMESTDLPMLVGYEAIGGSMCDTEFKVGVAPREFGRLRDATTD